jgi:hypothetical protein
VKERELRECSVCAICAAKIGKSQSPVFYRAKIDTYFVDIAAVQRQAGLAMMMGGNPIIANAMGPDEDMAQRLDGVTITVCSDCFLRGVDITQLAVVAAQRREGE